MNYSASRSWDANSGSTASAAPRRPDRAPDVLHVGCGSDGGPPGQVPQVRLDRPGNPNNDHLIFSKGHASPLLYAMYKAAGVITTKS